MQLLHPDPNFTLTFNSPYLVTNILHQHRCNPSFGPSTFISYGRPFFFIKSSTFSLLDRPLRAFLTVYFYPSWPFSVFTLDRPVFEPSAISCQDRSLSRTVHFQSFGPSSLSLLDRSHWTGPHLLKNIFIEKELLSKNEVEPFLIDLDQFNSGLNNSGLRYLNNLKTESIRILLPV